MTDWLLRTEMLIGKSGIEQLSKARVAVFGVGGVGCYCIEALARSGIGEIHLIDGDVFSDSNLNRQLYATVNTIGKSKVSAAKERISEINPKCKVLENAFFYSEETNHLFDFSKYDYIVDAIDSVRDKVELIVRAKEENIPIISCMGAGNKLDAAAFEVADIYKTSVCPLAKVMRNLLKKRGVKKLKVVYSKENPIKPMKQEGKAVPGSISFVPATAGLILAGEVIKDILSCNNKKEQV